MDYCISILRFFFCFLLMLTTLPPSLSQPPLPTPLNYSICLNPYKCGELPDLYYPFWGYYRPSYCGGGNQFELKCDEGPSMNYTTIGMGSTRFEVKDFDPKNYSLKIEPVRPEPGSSDIDVCSPEYNFNLSTGFSYYQTSLHNITLFYKCSAVDGGRNITCYDTHVYYEPVENDVRYHRLVEACGYHIQVPAEAVALPDPGEVDHDDLGKFFGESFEVKYNFFSQECVTCLKSKGACGSNESHPFTCYCPDGSNALNCSVPHQNKKHGLNWEAQLGIGVGCAVFGALVVCMAVYFYRRPRKTTHYELSYVQSRSLSSDPSLKDTEKGSQYFGVPLFTYKELEEATNYFDSSRELGDGGFGTVYFGKLPDGRCIAVKRLYENNYKRVEQFRNEIQILADLRHPNLVSLYGCTSRHSRELLLVYEYISNGTVADHLHGERAKAGTLPWHIRMKIAVETATALTYLHAKDIIHRDVKTNNILLDSHFVVRVADFGLSRLFPSNVTHISTAPQGTPGYVDPEYHECYQLTNKSDVYSFGVVLIELISSLPAVDITRHRHEINLSNMAINKIHNQALHELVDKNLGFESDVKVREMIYAVAELAFQCLQSSKEMRPSMEEVLDTLKDIQSDGKQKSQPEVMDITSGDDVVLLKDDPPPPSPDSNAVSKSTTPNASG